MVLAKSLNNTSIVKLWYIFGELEPILFLFPLLAAEPPAHGYLNGVVHAERIYSYKGQGAVPIMSCEVRIQGQVRTLKTIIMLILNRQPLGLSATRQPLVGGHIVAPPPHLLL